MDEPERTVFPVAWLTQYSAEGIRVLTLLGDLQRGEEGCAATDQELADRLAMTRNGVNRIILRFEDQDLDWSGLVRSSTTERGSYAGKRRLVRPVPEGTDLITVSAHARDLLRAQLFLVYCALSQWDGTGQAVTVARVAAACNVINHTARKAIDQLVAGGWVTQTRAPRGLFLYVLDPDGPVSDLS